MADISNQRRLAAILAADVAGYTRLVEQDTDGTVAAWKAARDDVIKPLVTEKSGRIIKFTGDGFLVEFPSVQDAVACAITMQEALASNSLNFRIGINLGDITDDGGDVHGEGVNIAARLEAMAEPGGICISGDVYSQVRNRIDASFEDRGEHEVKHVSHPVRVYTVNSGIAQQTSEPVPTSSPEPAQQAVKASIAILPFDNMSGDPDQEYFCDGVVEDIITEISKFRWLSVIARNSTFTYKGKSVDIKVVGQELGVRYVVEGSVRKAGDRIRINAQLIDSTDGSHVWAERYDRELADIFDVQDEITQTLVATIEPELSAAERTRARKKPTENLDAWDLLQKASWIRNQYNVEGFDEADALLGKAISLDPEMPYAYALRGHLQYVRVIMGYTDDPGKSLNQAQMWARKALALDDREAQAYLALGGAQYVSGDYEEAIKSLDRAIDLNPNFAAAYITKSVAMLLSETIDCENIRRTAEIGMRLSSKDTFMWGALNVMGGTYLLDGELEKAVDFYRKACRQPVTTYYPFFYQAGALKLLGRNEEAENIFATAMKMNPSFSHAKQIQQLGKYAVDRFAAVGIKKALKALGLPDA